MVTYGDMILRDVKRRKKPVQRELPVQVQALKFIDLALPGSFVGTRQTAGAARCAPRCK
jgi:hypothetical protein